MTTYDSARPVTIRNPVFRNAVKARVSERRGNEIDLWIGIPIVIDAYNPARDQAVETTHYVSGQAQTRTCLRWDGPTYTGSAFSSWTADYVGTMNGSWDRVFKLVHTSELSSARGTSRMYPTVRCRYKAWLTSREQALKTILVTAVRSTDHPTSSCSPLGQIRAPYRNGIAQGYDSLLDSNDLNEVERRPPNGEVARQIPALHEMGHYIGLMHRCNRGGSFVSRYPSDAAAPPMSSPDQDPRMGSRVTRSGADDEYCGGAEDGSLTHDLMGFGMQMNPWHAYVWKEVWEGLGTTPEGDAIPATGWVEQMA
jgi:hypothetical protein